VHTNLQGNVLPARVDCLRTDFLSVREITSVFAVAAVVARRLDINPIGRNVGLQASAISG
jgi:hypothetical protein